ncbi:hypothetical protein SAMN05216553_105213 [Lentzea fradiae]|uniref:Uncharacterized protein n=1 Tax=Lentzea fradiae TaxID=200378 RepID=A0A1G7RA42_9PSEU|nr:hypothetical protein [Lentzea fradiae]SDG07505.1 hypothetical protein SAMN05216553_105213 [Lentzea fradiae]
MRTFLAAGLPAPLAPRLGAGGPVEITFWSALRGDQRVIDAFSSLRRFWRGGLTAGAVR